jgi:hypothetical protein
MRAIVWFILVLISCLGLITAHGQNTEEVETEMVSMNNYDLSVIRVYPDSFPNVSVIFQAQNELGMPIWQLSPDELTVTENGVDCEILLIRNISNQIPVNIGLVLDASGSMGDATEGVLELYGDNWLDSVNVHYAEGGYFNKPWNDPLDHAKGGIRAFLKEENEGHDSIHFIGFNNKVFSEVPLSASGTEIGTVLDSLMPGGGTAFYDALIASIHALTGRLSETVIVALTDGMDGDSRATKEQAIALAQQLGFKIYVVGLGRAVVSDLQDIANETGGFFYYTNEPEQLTEIYQTIKRQIRSVYQLDYSSQYHVYNQTDINIRFSFVNDTLKFLNDQFDYELPEEAIAYIKRQDQLRQIATGIGVGLGTVMLIGLTVFLLKRQQNKPELTIVKTYPNPFQNDFIVEYKSHGISATDITVEMLDTKNQPVSTIATSLGDGQIRVVPNDAGTGLHLVRINHQGLASEFVKILKK